MARQAQDRALVGAREADHLDVAGGADQDVHPEAQQPGPGPGDVERPVEAVRTADTPGNEPGRRTLAHDRHSTMSTSTRRFSLTAEAFTTVRSALAVRPPRPMTRP